MPVATIDEYISRLDVPNREIAAALRAHIDVALPEAEGRMWHGHPVWLKGKTPVAGFKAYPTQVTFMLWRGREIADPTGTLAPSGSGQMSTLKIADTDGFDGSDLDGWLRQADALD